MQPQTLARMYKTCEGVYDLSGKSSPAPLVLPGRIRAALRGSKTFELDGYRIPCIGKVALIAKKKSAGRHKDLANVEERERLKED